jgi:hypothetical protein
VVIIEDSESEEESIHDVNQGNTSFNNNYLSEIEMTLQMQKMTKRKTQERTNVHTAHLK